MMSALRHLPARSRRSRSAHPRIGAECVNRAVRNSQWTRWTHTRRKHAESHAANRCNWMKLDHATRANALRVHSPQLSRQLLGTAKHVFELPRHEVVRRPGEGVSKPSVVYSLPYDIYALLACSMHLECSKSLL